jgi:hypothetical protein
MSPPSVLTQTLLLLPASLSFTPLERILLTANGNVQRILSAFHNSPVTVIIKYNTLRKETAGDYITFDREVQLECCGRMMSRAKSVVEVKRDSEYADMVLYKDYGIAQLFRAFDILPEFELQSAGRGVDGGVWREYTLEARKSGIRCSIREDYEKDVFELYPYIQNAGRCSSTPLR